MKLLLDSHAFLWFVEGSKKLSPKAKHVIEEPSHRAFVSIASIWELGIKISLGRLETDLSLARIVEECDSHQIELLEIVTADIVTMSSLEFIHRDPFDRMLIAQALNADLVVVTKDKWFDAYGVKRLWSR